VAFSRELASAGAVVGLLLAVVALGPAAALELHELARRCLGGAEPNQGLVALTLLGRWVAVFGGCAAAGALAAALGQIGLRLKLRLDLSRLDPVRGLGRLFSRERLADLGMMLVRAMALAGLGAWLAWDRVRDLLIDRPIEILAPAAARALLGIAVWLTAATLLLAALDALLQRRRFRRRMRMTREEAIRERKEQDGDPMLHAERRRRHRLLLQGGGLAALPQASVVVVNPTHLAVALRYLPGEDQAPVVVCSGRESLARRIREQAARIGVPIIEHVPLARALIQLEPGEEIPEALYLAAAEVIRAVQALDAGTA
jgi:type III secretion protein U